MVITGAGLVEREEQLQALGDAIGGSSDSGAIVLLAGEAGIGKTSVLETALARLDHRYTVMIAACEPIGVPAPFAPLFDIFGDLPRSLQEDLRSGAARPVVYAGMLDVIKNDRVVVAFEDMHWADEASLGLVRYLGRRIGATGSTLIITYRSEEVGLIHPLRLVIADLGPRAVRIDLPPLSLAGVVEMTRGIALDPAQVLETTLGNPFLVEEVVRHPHLRVPPTVENMVLAGVSHLPEETLEILRMVALSPDGIDLGLLESVFSDADRYLDLAVQRRLLVSSGSRVACRHDLVRDSLLRTLPPALARQLHRRLLLALTSRDPDLADTPRLAYHSVGAGDSERAVSYSLAAARSSAAARAHRQAALHYANALEYHSVMDLHTLDQTLLLAANEHSLINEFRTAAELAARRVELAVDAVDRARARAWHAFFLSRQNELVTCRQEALAAVEVLRAQPASEELALGLAVAAWGELVEGDRQEAIRYGNEAVAVSREAGTPSVEVHAATTVGTARFMLGDAAGRLQVEEAAQIGVDADLGEFAARALNNLGLLSLWRGRLGEAHRAFQRLIDYTVAHELDAWYIAAISTRATIAVAMGLWGDADRDLEMVRGQRTCQQTEIENLVTAAKLRARRGDPGAVELIGEAVAAVGGFPDHEANVTVCALLLEAAWIGLVPTTEVENRYTSLLDAPALLDDRSGRGVLGYWAKRLDMVAPSDAIPGPAGLEWAGDPAAAVRSWEERGFPVEALVTRAMLPGADLDQVLAELAQLGAHGVIRGLVRELRRRGVKHIPRGARPTTRENPAGLTRRQEEVLSLMTSGLSNAAIAQELFISEKTTGHHVSAILTKLGVANRLQAVVLANANGWFQPE